jgi:hypothetical protein
MPGSEDLPSSFQEMVDVVKRRKKFRRARGGRTHFIPSQLLGGLVRPKQKNSELRLGTPLMILCHEFRVILFIFSTARIFRAAKFLPCRLQMLAPQRCAQPSRQSLAFREGNRPSQISQMTGLCRLS